MFFTWFGTIVAWLALAFGGMRVGLGFYVASNLENPSFDASRYLSGTSGQAIDQGIYVILFAIALGTLTEISRSVRARN